MGKIKNLIVGCGISGATMARLLAERGEQVTVIDSKDHIAGNIYTKEIENIQVHWYGAHIFHTSNKEVWNYVQQFAEFRITKIIGEKKSRSVTPMTRLVSSDKRRGIASLHRRNNPVLYRGIRGPERLLCPRLPFSSQRKPGPGGPTTARCGCRRHPRRRWDSSCRAPSRG